MPQRRCVEHSSNLTIAAPAALQVIPLRGAALTLLLPGAGAEHLFRFEIRLDLTHGAGSSGNSAAGGAGASPMGGLMASMMGASPSDPPPSSQLADAGGGGGHHNSHKPREVIEWADRTRAGRTVWLDRLARAGAVLVTSS